MYTHIQIHIQRDAQPLGREMFGLPPTGREWFISCIHLLTPTWEAKEKPTKQTPKPVDIWSKTPRGMQLLNTVMENGHC